MNLTPEIDNFSWREGARDSYSEQVGEVQNANVTYVCPPAGKQPDLLFSFLNEHAYHVVEFKHVANLTAKKDKEWAIDFRSLVERWERETSFHSSLGEILTHPAYQQIIDMGRKALPMILSDLVDNPRHWFYALTKIVGHDVAAGAKGYADARAKWLTWAFDKEYI